MFNLEQLNRIYDRLGDDLSKEIFKNRLMYSISKDLIWIHENVRTIECGRKFLDKLDECAKNGKMAIFGAGVWGCSLYRSTKTYPWEFFIDSAPKTPELEGLPVISYKDFVEIQKKEFFNKNNGWGVFVSSRIHYKSMQQQLISDFNCPADEEVRWIINVGKKLDDLSAKQYFDLEIMKPSEGKEVFLDVGGYDGTTSVYFSKWAKPDSFVYVFEPDLKNIEKCRNNLNSHYVNYEIIPKGVWSKETTLNFNMLSNGASHIEEAGLSGDSSIEVTSLDHVFENNGVIPTFIKMDIEGSEMQALLGAKKVITKYQPKLAISVYHKDEDIWEIPQLILNYNSQYKLYLRHYSLTDFETVLYALPK